MQFFEEKILPTGNATRQALYKYPAAGSTSGSNAPSEYEDIMITLVKYVCYYQVTKLTTTKSNNTAS